MQLDSGQDAKCSAKSIALALSALALIIACSSTSVTTVPSDHDSSVGGQQNLGRSFGNSAGGNSQGGSGSAQGSAGQGSCSVATTCAAGDFAGYKICGTGACLPLLVSGAAHNCYVTNTGAVRCWGHGAYGQLGGGTLTSQ